MSRIIDPTWECPLCASQNPTKIMKPSILGQTIAHRTCEVCESKVVLKFKHAGVGNVSYESIKVDPSPKGIELHKERTEPKPKPQAQKLEPQREI